MPDNWDDVGAPSPDFPDYSNGRTRAYESYENSSTNVLESLPIDSAECLYMICLLSGFQPEAMENFRAEEIGDVDNDQRPEFLDAWGRPIAFIRWPTAFDGPVTLNQDTDPFDPEAIDRLLDFFLMLCLLCFLETTTTDAPTEVPRFDSTPLLERCE